MPGRWPGHVPKFSGTAWNVPTARALDEFLRTMHKGMSNLQGVPGTPRDVIAAEDAGVGPAPALDDHVHRLGIISSKGDMIVSNGTDPVALAVGADEYVLAGSSSAGGGVAWSSIAKDARLLAWLGLGEGGD